MQASQKRKRHLNLRQQDTLVAWLLLVPGLIIILAITFQPVLSTLYLSFFDVSSGIKAHQTFVSFVSVAAELVLGIAIAQLITARPFGWRFLRVSLIIPWAVPTIVNGAVWRWIYDANYGALNAALSQLGLIQKYIPWLIDPNRAMNLVILADVWHSVPFIALIIQAAMATLPVELDEAAAVDGATYWDRFWLIRIPLLRPAILVALVIRSVEAFRVFDIVYVITAGGPASGTTTISYQTYLETFSYGNLGRGAALSFLVSAFTLIMAYVYIRFLYRPQDAA